MTRPTASRDDGMLCCDVGSARFAFRSSDVRHVERAEYMRADRADGGRVGTLRLGGQQVPVCSLSEVFGMPSGDDRIKSRDGHIAVTGDRNALTGWLVDRIIRVAEPAAGDVAALPAIVGGRATSWFEALVWLGENDSALLLAPHHLTSTASRVDVGDGTPAFARLQSIVAADPEPVAVVFSTTVLPSSETRRFALSGRQIAAIVQPTATITVPGCSEYVDGVTWWRRSVVPVIDFRAPADRDGTHRRRLIAQCGARQHGSLVAFSIDAEVVMCRPTADHHALATVACPPFASGMFDVKGEAVALLDLDALLEREHRIGTN
jgi:chemotaxis signal transduction protein